MAPGLRLLPLVLLAHRREVGAAGFGRQAPVRADHAAVEQLISEIVANMTVAEKARELDTTEGINFLTNGACNESKSAAWLAGKGIGRIHDLYATDPAVTNAVQKQVTQASRFGIGAIMGEECTHGYQKDGHTMFPAPIGSAASFDPELLGEVGAAIGREARGFGTTECWSPILGLAREPRWGRTNEEFGEDTLLASRLGAAMISGMQCHGDLSNASAVSSLMKHFALYSVPENGLNDAPARKGRREVESEYLPVFAAGVAAGAQGVMPSYNSIDGIPVAADKWLLTDTLRTEWGFDGVAMGDFGAIGRLQAAHHVAANPNDCVAQYLNAGGNQKGSDIDIEAPVTIVCIALLMAAPVRSLQYLTLPVCWLAIRRDEKTGAGALSDAGRWLRLWTQLHAQRGSVKRESQGCAPRKGSLRPHQEPTGDFCAGTTRPSLRYTRTRRVD